jgi:uncharacterized membrane protein YeiH
MFAATGALAASRKQVDIIAFLFLGIVTGVGGGTLRDLILGEPVFWVEQPRFLAVCILTAAAVYFTAHHLESRYRTLLWLDAFALASYGVFGAYRSLQVTDSVEVAVIMGVMTGTVGGILRDMLSSEPSVLMREEIYITAAMSGALFFALGQSMHLPLPYVAGVATLLAFAIRSGAISRGWRLPRYRRS